MNIYLFIYSFSFYLFIFFLFILKKNEILVAPPQPAYNQYFGMYCPLVKKQYPTASDVQISQALSLRWQQMTGFCFTFLF